MNEIFIKKNSGEFTDKHSNQHNVHNTQVNQSFFLIYQMD